MTGDLYNRLYHDEIGGFNYSDDYSVCLANEVIDGTECYVLELTADSPDVLYASIQMWVEVDKWYRQNRLL